MRLFAIVSDLHRFSRPFPHICRYLATFFAATILENLRPLGSRAHSIQSTRTLRTRMKTGQRTGQRPPKTSWMTPPPPSLEDTLENTLEDTLEDNLKDALEETLDDTMEDTMQGGNPGGHHEELFKKFVID